MGAVLGVSCATQSYELRMRVRSMLMAMIAALSLARCVRRAPSATRDRAASNRPVYSQTIAPSPVDASAPIDLVIAPDASSATIERQLEAEAVRAGIAPLFARKAGRLAAVDPRGYSRQRREDGGHRPAPLSMSELVARPWLWALSPGAFALGGSWPRGRDGGQDGPLPAAGRVQRSLRDDARRRPARKRPRVALCDGRSSRRGHGVGADRVVHSLSRARAARQALRTRRRGSQVALSSRVTISKSSSGASTCTQ